MVSTARPRSKRLERLERLDNWGLRAITGGALIFAIIGAVTLVIRAWNTLTAESLSITGLQLANAQSPEFADAAPAIVSAHYDSVSLVVAGLPAGVRWLMVSELTIATLLGIGLCVIVFILGMRLLDGRPFARSATWSVIAAAILVMITGMAAPFLLAISNAEVVTFLGDAVTTVGADAAANSEGLLLFSLTLDPTSLGWGLALAVVAAAFQLGQRMQHDTERLI